LTAITNNCVGGDGCFDLVIFLSYLHNLPIFELETAVEEDEKLKTVPFEGIFLILILTDFFSL